MTPEKMLEKLKKKCLLVREKYKDNPGDYYQEKYDRVMSINNPRDACVLIGMFDLFNQAELFGLLTNKEREYRGKLFKPLADTLSLINELRAPMIK